MRSLLTRLLAVPEDARRLAGEEWNIAIRQARQTQLLGQFAAALRRAGVFDELPEPVLRHLRLALLTSRSRCLAATWEIGTLRRAVPPHIPLVLLKGAAYDAATDANAEGRLFSDIDLLVPRASLDRTEASLLAEGWMPKRVNAYDQRYYRQWSHEIPPLEHVRRHTVVDLHHAIVPPISRYSFAPEKLFAALDEVLPGIHVLKPRDRVIHCAVHLIQEGEASKVFRDLYDLHLLLGQHCASAQDWEGLLERAGELGVGRLVAAAATAAEQVFGTTPPSGIRGGWLKAALVQAALAHDPAAVGSLAREAARFTLLAHSHWMKMPAHILLPHLCRKAVVGLFAKEEQAGA